MYKIAEIFKLKQMLEEADIPFEFADRTFSEPEFVRHMYQIGYPVLPPNNGNICSIIEGFGTYGAKEDLLEIMGLLTDEELKEDDVKGFLTAENVFERIKNHYYEG